jgi:hypothetical protein
MDHISGNKSRIGSIEAPIGRYHPEEQHTKFMYAYIHFYGHGWPSK